MSNWLATLLFQLKLHSRCRAVPKYQQLKQFHYNSNYSNNNTNLGTVLLFSAEAPLDDDDTALGVQKIAWPFIISGAWCVITSSGYAILGTSGLSY